MALQIVNQGPPPEVIAEQLREAIETALPEAQIRIDARGPGHFEICVVSTAFEGRSRVQQHQLVYGAITELMSGADAPVHAIDKLECRTS